MKRLVIIILAGVFVIGTAAIADNQSDHCTTRLKGLTAQQVEKINQMEDQHQKIMDNLRDERRSTTNWMEKDKIRAKMLEQKENHYSQLKKVLTAEQWAEFESLHQGRNGQNHGNGQGHYAQENRNGCQGNGIHSGKRGNGNSGRGHKKGNSSSGSRNSNSCFRTSHTSNSNIDTSQYHTDNFNTINL